MQMFSLLNRKVFRVLDYIIGATLVYCTVIWILSLHCQLQTPAGMWCWMIGLDKDRTIDIQALISFIRNVLTSGVRRHYIPHTIRSCIDGGNVVLKYIAPVCAIGAREVPVCVCVRFLSSKRKRLEQWWEEKKLHCHFDYIGKSGKSGKFEMLFLIN